MSVDDRPAEVNWLDDGRFEVAGTTFRDDWREGVSGPDDFAVMKPRALVEQYIEVLRTTRGGNVVELGIREGGSTALIALLGRPARLVAIEIEAEAPALTSFVERQGLAEVVRPYFAVDQSDRDQMNQILSDEFGDAPLDLVFDDASHRFGPTTVSFECLFPRLAPGGLFIIEDWCGEYTMAHGVQQRHDDETAARHERVVARINELVADPGSPAAARLDRRLALALADESAGGHERVVTRINEMVADPGSPAAAHLNRRLALALDDETAAGHEQVVARINELVADPGSPAAAHLNRRLAQILADETAAGHERLVARINELVADPGSPAAAQLEGRLALALADDPSPEPSAEVTARMEADAGRSPIGDDPAAAPALADVPSEDAPLAKLVLQLVLLRAGSGDVVGDLTVGPHWTVVRRGPAPLDPRTFRVAEALADPFDLLDR